MSFHVPESFRLMKPHRMGSDDSFGNNGVFVIPVKVPKNKNHAPARWLYVICSDGAGWEHLSAHAYVESLDRSYVPTWEEMCFLKSLFWEPEDVVVQYHPRESDYVRTHPHVLHLWRKVGYEFPTPPPALAGFK